MHICPWFAVGLAIGGASCSRNSAHSAGTGDEVNMGFGCGLHTLASGIIVGTLAGIPTGALLDMAILGNPEKSVPKHERGVSQHRTTLRLSPSVDPRSGTFGLTLMGTL